MNADQMLMILSLKQCKEHVLIEYIMAILTVSITDIVQAVWTIVLTFATWSFRRRFKHSELRLNNKLKKLQYFSIKLQDKKNDILEELWIKFYKYSILLRNKEDMQVIREGYKCLDNYLTENMLYIDEVLYSKIDDFLNLAYPDSCEEVEYTKLDKLHMDIYIKLKSLLNPLVFEE